MEKGETDDLMIGTFDHFPLNPGFSSRLFILMLRPSLLIYWRNYFRLIRQRELDVRNLWNTLSTFPFFPPLSHLPPCTFGPHLLALLRMDKRLASLDKHIISPVMLSHPHPDGWTDA